MGLGTAVAYLTLDATGFAKGIDFAMADAKRLNTGFSNISNTATNIGKSITGVGKVLTAGITAPVVGFGVASIKSGAEFDKSMSDVKAVSMSTKTDMDKLSKAADDLGVSYKKGTNDADTAFNALRATAIKMGNDTKFTAKESADALYYMGLAGWSADQSISGIPAVLSLASAGNTELARTSDIVTDAITGFGHSADESVSVVRGGFNKEIPIATRLADIMASTMANSNTDVDMLGDSFKYVTPIAGSFGYSMEDVSLSLGLMANAGIKSTQAGTTLRQGLKRLVAPTDKAREAMEKYNWSAADSNGNIKPLRQQLDELRGIFGNLDIEVTKADGTLKTSDEIMQEYGKKLPTTEQEKLNDAVQVFGTTALPGMLALMNTSQDSMDKLASAIDNSSAAFVMHNGEIMTYDDAIKQFGEDVVNTSDTFEILGSAEGMALLQLDNLHGDWTLFKSALGTTKQIISDMANGALRDFVQSLTDLVRKFNEMDPEQQKHIVKLGLMAAAIGPVLIGFGKVVTALGNFKGAIQLLTGTTSPATTLLGNLATKALNVKESFALAKAGFPGFGKEASLLGTKLGSVAGAFTEASTAAGGGFTGVLQGAKAALMAFFSPVTIVVAVIGTLVAAFVYLMKTNEEFRDTVIGKFKDLWSNLQGYFQQITDAVNSLGFNFKDIVDVIKGAWEGLCNLLAPILQGLITLITNAIDVIANAVTGIIQEFSGIIGVIVGIFSGDGEQIKTSAKTLMDGVLNIFQSIGKLLLLPFTAIFEVINNIFGTSLPTTFEEFGNFISSIFNAIGKVIMSIVDFIAKIPGKIVGFFSSVVQFVGNVVSSIGAFLSNVISAIAGFVSSLVSKAKEIVVGFVNKVIEGFSNIIKTVKNVVTTVISFIARFVSNLIAKAKEIIVNFIDKLVNGFTKIVKGIKDTVTKVISTVANWVKNLVSKAKEIIVNFVEKVVKGFVKIYTGIKDVITNVISAVANWVVSMVSKAVELGIKFINAIINFFKQLPHKIYIILTNIINFVKTFVSNMVSKAKEVGSGFINNIITPIIKLPGKLWNILTQAISNVVKFVINIGKKGLEAGKALVDNVKAGAAKILSTHAITDIGKNIIEGVWNGIKGMGNWIKDKVGGFFGGILDKAKSVLGIHSPSTVFEKQVGLNIVLGTAKGIRDNAKHAENAVKYMVDKVLKVTGNAYEREYKKAVESLDKTQKEIDRIQDKIQKTTDKKAKEKLKKQLKNLKEEKKNQKQAIADLQADYLSYCDSQLSQETKLYNMSNKQIVEYWKKVRSHLKKGTQAYKEATQKIVDAQITMYAEMVSKAEENLNKMKSKRDVSLAEEIKYWENVRKHCLAGSKAYEEATDKINAARKELNDKLKEADKTLKDGIASVAEETKQKVQDIINSYNDAVKSTKETLMGLSGLFEAFSADEAISGDDLLNNLQTQVDGLTQWNDIIDRLFSRGLPQDLIDELKAMGPKAMGSIESLLNMTDEQLEQYIVLWEKKNEEAQDAATKMVDKTPYTEQIQKTIEEAKAEIKELVDEYNKTMKELGSKTRVSAKKVSLDFLKQFKKSLSKDVSDADFSFIGNKLKEYDYSSVGKAVSKRVSSVISQGLSKGVTIAVNKVKASSPILISSIEQAISEKKVNVSSYINVGIRVVNNTISGVKRQTPQLDAQMKSTGIQSQNSFIAAIKSKEQAVYDEGVNIGKQLDNGMADGIEKYIGSVISAAVEAVQAAIAAAQGAAGIASPSKVMAMEVGKWLPLGMAKGFVDYTPQATNDMQDAIDESVNSLSVDDVDIFPNIKSVGEEVKDAFRDVSQWFANVSKNVTSMTDTMKENIQEVVDITDGMLYNVYDDSSESLNNLISGKNVKSEQVVTKDKDDKKPDDDNSPSQTFIFNSPKPIDELQAARLLKQTSRDLALEFD